MVILPFLVPGMEHNIQRPKHSRHIKGALEPLAGNLKHTGINRARSSSSTWVTYLKVIFGSIICFSLLRLNSKIFALNRFTAF